MKKTILLMALFGLIALMASCSKGEEVTISKYFEAIKMNDTDTLGAMALEPKKIIHKKYEVVAISEPLIEPLQLSNLEKKLADLTAGRKKQLDAAMDKQYEMEDLQDELEETRRRSKKKELEEQIAVKKEEMDAEKKKLYGVMQDINNTKNAISREKALIKSSTGVSENFALYTGESYKSEATVKVTLPDGGTQDYIFRMISYQMSIQDRPRNGRLVILKIATPEELEAEKKAAEEAANTESQEVTEEEPTEEKPAEEENKQ